MSTKVKGVGRKTRAQKIKYYDAKKKQLHTHIHRTGKSTGSGEKEK